MSEIALLERLSQAESSEISEVFQAFLRGAARQAVISALTTEVEALCGPSYQPSGGKYYRAGSAPGEFCLGVEQERITRPRVRCKQGGKTSEVRLQAYEAAQDRADLQAAIIRAFTAGVSSRDQKSLHKGVRGASKSEVSRLWQKEGARCIDELRSRDLREDDYAVLMLDGIALCDSLTAVVALGITCSGEKKILDFQVGASENSVVCTDLITRIVERGFKPKQRLLAVTDGSKALRKSIRKMWSDAVVQRCLIHKARNIKGYLSYRHHAEVDRLFSRLRKAQGLKAAKECVNHIRLFLSGKNAEALNSLEEAGDELLAVHELEVPSTLNSTLLNTNCIENPFRNVRAKTRRVSRWKPNTLMAEKWLAYALLEAEKGFRRINHYEDIKTLVAKLRNAPPPPEEVEPHQTGANHCLDKTPETNYK